MDCFKPYYNWNTFNTEVKLDQEDILKLVLNLIITGIPSIPVATALTDNSLVDGFKPYYNWNTFNTTISPDIMHAQPVEVLNLIITGIPSIL